MWLFAMFDIPVGTPADRRAATKFRKDLLKNGFQMLQFSVYARYMGSEARSDALRLRLKRVLPAHGEVRLLSVTDIQFGRMEVIQACVSLAPEEIPPLLLLM